ncbi:hypothetical protein A2303_07145 [Candidatus Falkowbacteria bacterium RIFOXYB2_FULL_47_14]|uniref:Uncharacterized protein n=1 Tax=Candidatus Falkowbacteria bacterium RIFOXYA2_FULL_47_19 TaxID=1797994 RepID=A0A1F5SGE7_9BACT|nr:MAG: hypothetical protein A2227_00890 [Candidatus Falkowbacteria bacterium RIFOXYA2_FULL_47_19]OGF34926.1 MAG: hypothetical protein A2468_06850 [Candidatus Falkowbacteria bacterium RIFOXYC2_FULL_46_15]OGF43641.1 MAG: hypothetical protein A2303_07145 [Candidatus Falkowbacteria bacterium RIFOXYB2_FULL_47_14]
MKHEQPNLKNKEKETLFDKKWYQERFHWLRDEHLDDLPEEDVRNIIPSNDPRYNMFKCQGNYISGLKYDLESALMDGMIRDESLKKDVKEFLKFKFGFSEGKFTTREEIDKCNTILDKVIDYLDNK